LLLFNVKFDENIRYPARGISENGYYDLMRNFIGKKVVHTGKRKGELSF
jgi:hypothetical protein